MKKKITYISVILVIIVAIAATLARNKKELNAKNVAVDRSEVPVSVTTAKASLLPVQGDLSLPAVLAADEEALISAAVQGRITSLNFVLGSKVSKGQLLGTIDTKQKQLSLQTTELTVTKMGKDYERDQELLKGNAIQESAVTDSRYNYESNKLQAQQIRQQIADADIISPISGIITAKNLVVGEFANIGTSIATVVDIHQLKAVVHVNEKDVYKMQQGQKAVVTSDVFSGKTFTGKVTFISPKGDENHNYQVEVLVENNATQLKAGTYVKVSFHMDNSSTSLQIPKKALVEGIKNPYVYISAGNKATQRKLVLGREIGENIEVLSGLKEGEDVVIDGLINLIEGSVIEKINK